MFFVGVNAGPGKSLLAAVMLTGVILLGVVMTFWVSRLLSATILKGVPSSFTLELPPYRRPRVGQVIARSVLDRTLFVLGRAVAVAAPAGLVIWLCANVQVGGVSVLAHCTGFLDPFARLLGLDGVILMAFILGFPANEIVIPIIIMSYLSTGTLLELDDLGALHELLVRNGWTWLTAVCTMLFSLMHWPCSTTCMTIGKETKSMKWTLLSFAIPTGIGMVVCFLVASGARIYGERKKSFRSDGWCIERIGEATRIYGLKMKQEAETPGESERSPAGYREIFECGRKATEENGMGGGKRQKIC